MKTHALGSILALAAICGLAASASLATPPAYTITSLAKSGNTVNGIGSTINLPQGQYPNSGSGFFGVSVNNAGSWLLNVDTPTYNHTAPTTTGRAVIATQAVQGPFTPYMALGLTGYLSVPSATTVPLAFLATAMNNSGNAVFAMTWAANDFDLTPLGTAVFFNNNKVVFNSGDALAAPGLAAGTTWNEPDSSTHLTLNDNNQLLVVSTVTESGASRRVAVRLQLDATGNVLGTTLVAKEGGPVGAGPDTWTSIAAGPHVAAMNNAGTVAISGTTAGGTNGIYSSAGAGSFVAVAGGASPIAGVNWYSLAGSPVDINNSGVVAFNGLAVNGNGTYTEASPDAGELPLQEGHTYGNGPLNLIIGTLSNDQDADVYRITVTDPNTFSATTVPDPASGFPGAAFDTVLTLIGDGGEHGAGSTPGARTQCDNVSPTILQSTITGSGGKTRVGGSYLLAISTPKSRPGKQFWHYATNANPAWDLWWADPANLAVSDGLIYWPDPSANSIRRTTTAGVNQSDLAVATVASGIAIDSVAGKVYWVDQNAGTIRRSNLDGSFVEDVVGGAGSSTLSANECTGIAVDSVRGRLYWSRSIRGELNSVDIGLANATRIIRNSILVGAPTIPAGQVVGNFAPSSIAVDTSPGTTGKIYWVNSITNYSGPPSWNRIERCNLDGTGRATVIDPAGATSIAIDSAAGKLYWTNTGANKVQRSNLDGTAVEDVSLSSQPYAISLDVAGGFVYFTNILDRVVRRASIAGTLPASASDVVSAGVEFGESAPNGPSSPYSGYFGGWTRLGSSVATALPYQIKLTGATFEAPYTILAKGNQKIAATGDPVSGVPNSVLSTIALFGWPIKLSDRGDVLWAGTYLDLTPTNSNTNTFDGFLFNQDLLLKTNQVLTTSNLDSQEVVYLIRGSYMFDFSSDGTNAVVELNMHDSPYNFSALQRDNALLFQFSYPASTGACCNGTACSVSTQAACTGAYQGASTACGPTGNPTTCCRANFNGVNGISVQDIFDFLNAWFAGNPAADFNGGGLSVQDIFDFLNAWFAGC